MDFANWLVRNNIRPVADSVDLFMDHGYYDVSKGTVYPSHELVKRYLKDKRQKEERDE